MRFSKLWLILLVLFLIGAWFKGSQSVIDDYMDRDEEKRIAALHLRAATISLAAESIARLGPMHKGPARELTELARQPGIAWIALTNRAGSILLDSAPGVTGAELYSEREMNILEAGVNLQGRFLPDDANIYETWQLFRPERLGKGHREAEEIIFVALDATGIQTEMAAEYRRGWIIALGLLCLLLLAFACAVILVRYMNTKKRLNHKIEESRRLAELGKIASGLAHEIRNPLSSICGYATYLEKIAGDNGRAASAAQLIAEEADRLNTALTGLLQLARKPRPNLQKTPLAPLLKRVCELGKPDAEHKQIEIVLHIALPETLAPLVDGNLLTQALLNLLLNAIQACNEGDTVTLGADMLMGKAADLPPEADPGKAYLHIQARDTGPGMEAGALEQIFTPYFTTRAEGVGLGLAITRQIIEAHGGIITVASAPGKGATFNVYLPQELK